MTYEEAIQYLYHIAPPFHEVGAKAYKPGLERMKAMLHSLGAPHRNYPTVHVAGTNGKGSTAHLIAAALAAEGKKVGLYTSPHLIDFAERIRIIDSKATDGIRPRYISHEQISLYIEQWSGVYDTGVGNSESLISGASFFEVTTAMAFAYFAQKKVDIAVIEVGLGGLLDATNVITPVLSVITSIGLDHTELLGSTLPLIAEQKGGIIKDAVPCVVAETDPQTEQVFTHLAAEHHSTLYFADQCEFLRRQRLRFAVECELQGDYQQKNLQTAFVALRALGVPYKSIAEGFAKVITFTGLRGRWERIESYGGKPTIICDTGHNSHGVRAYIDQLLALPRPLHIVFGMVADKDYIEVLSLLPTDAHYYFTQPSSSRALPAEELAKQWLVIHPEFSEDKLVYPSVKEALYAALSNAEDNGTIFIGGSNYVVGEALKNL